MEQDGSYMLLVKTPSGEVVEIAFSPAMALHFVQTFHAAIMSHWPHWPHNTPDPEFPVLVLKRLIAGDGFPQPEVMATTDRIANVMLSASDAVLEQAQNAISQVLELRAAKGKDLH